MTIATATTSLNPPEGSSQMSRDGKRAAVEPRADAAEADQPPEQGTSDSAQSPMIEITDVRAIATSDRIDLHWIDVHLRRAIGAIERNITRVSVQLIDEAQMKTLHNRAFGDAIVTDVLSFDASQISTQIEADIAVCVNVASRESSQRNHSIERELLLYALHGLLHCCGYDDHDEVGFAAMHAEEDRILATIGAGITFAAGATGDPGRPGNNS